MPPRAHPFYFMRLPHDHSRKVRSMQVRDATASLEVLAALQDEDYRIGETLLNHPPQPWRQGGEEPAARVDLRSVPPRDLILTCTRMPDDPAEATARQLRPSGTDLETLLVELWHGYLEIISREHVRVAEALRGKIAPGFENRRDMFFRMYRGAFYKTLSALDGRRRERVAREARSAAFLLHLDAIRPGGPGYLGIFGMDGDTTLVWAWLLRHRMPELLKRRGFVMAELRGGEVPERCTDYGWIQGWEAQVILEHPV